MKKLISLALILTLTASAAVLSACGKKDSSPSAKTSDTPSAQSSEQSRPQVSEESIEVSMDESKPKITQTQLDELNKNKFISYSAAIKAVSGFSEEKRSEFFRILVELAKAGDEIIIEQAKKNFGNFNVWQLADKIRQ